GLSCIRGERTFANLGIGPSGSYRYQFFVQAGGACTIQAEAAKKNDTGDGIRRLSQAGPRQIVVDESLGDESAEKALDDTVFEVQVNHVVGENAGILEDDRANRRIASPLPGFLVALPRRAQRIHRIRPAGVRSLTLIESGERKSLGATLGRNRLEGFISDHA